MTAIIWGTVVIAAIAWSTDKLQTGCELYSANKDRNL